MNPVSTDSPPDNATEEYDFIVVGSGAGGGPLAANLALAGHSVLVLEAGDDHVCPYYSIPIMQAYASEDSDMRWSFFAHHWDDPAAARRDSKFVPANDGVLYPRGSTLGGSTAISAMVTIYSNDRDWERMQQLTGDPLWGPDKMRERFRRIETWRGVDAKPLPGDDEASRDSKAAHGHHGWLGTTRADPDIAGRESRFLDVINAMETTSRQLFDIPEEVSLPRDVNAADTPRDFQGMSFVPVAVRDGERNGSRERVQTVAESTANLTVRLNSLVTKVLFEGCTAIGVEYLHGPRLYGAAAKTSDPEDPGSHKRSSLQPVLTSVRARREVILAGGAFNTPQMLKLSGIGPRGELRRWGIPLVSDLPGVGENLHDRYEVSVTFELDKDYPIFDGSSLDVPKDTVAGDPLFNDWRDHRNGPYTTNGSLASIVAKSSVSSDVNDLIVFALPIDFHGYYPGYAKAGARFHNRLSILVLKAQTNNRSGSVNLRSADPTEVPNIHFRYFDQGSPGWAEDLQGVVDGIKIARAIAQNLEEIEIIREITPGDGVDDEADIARFVQDEAWGHHACGTAKIGTDDDPMSVLDKDFRVRGVNNLRVVDASVFPNIPGFFIVTPVYLISELASEKLLAQYPGADAR